MNDLANGLPDPADDAAQEHPAQPRALLSGVLGWVVSGALHGALILLAGTVYFLIHEPEVDVPPTHQTYIESSPKPPETKPEKRDIQAKIEIALPESDTPAPSTTVEVPVEQPSSEDPSEVPQPKGREDAVADREAGGPALFMAIGAGGPASGILGNRKGGGPKRSAAIGGGSVPSQRAVDAAFRWFKRHQSPNGAWEGDRFNRNCVEDPKCEPGDIGAHPAEQVTVAATGYALMCFLAHGYDHKSPGPYRSTVKKGIDYLLSVQQADGLMGSRNYEHPVATKALAEAYAMTGDPELKAPAQKGVSIILARQNQDAGAKDSAYAGLGWDYAKPNARNDSSVTGWNVMALESALAAGLDVGHGLEGAKTWLDKAWKATNPGWEKLDPYTGESRFPYTWNTASGASDKDHLASVGMTCAVFLGHRSGDVVLETLANWVAKHQTPKSYPCNAYFLYYNSLGMFQVGGDRWKTWNSTVRDMLVNAQRQGQGCFDGSWDPEGSGPSKISRVLSTAYCCLSLEVYYSYDRIVAK